MSDLTRRHALRLLAGASGALACSRKDPPEEPASRASGNASPSVVLGVRSLPRAASPWPVPDPFLFCVHHDDRYPIGNEEFGPGVSIADRNLGSDFSGQDGFSMYHGRVVPGFPAHPHRGFETVTVVRRGLLDHADSLGAAARYGEGDVQWLTAGAGIQHAEMFPLLARDRENPLELFQIWLNLPRESKMVAPHFKMLWSGQIPRKALRDDAGRVAEVTLAAGNFDRLTAPSPPPSSWAARSDHHVGIWTVRLEPGARVTLPVVPAGVNRTLYFFRGSELALGGAVVRAREAADLNGTIAATVENGSSEGEFLVLEGRPIGEPVARRGPFVMNTNAEIRAAYEDYQATRFGGWPWDSQAPVHGPERTRFARRPDGTVETPT